MSVGPGDEISTEDVGHPGKEDLEYEAKTTSKLVRVLTVLAYLLSVSLAAILLSIYYICVWKSPDLPAINSSASSEPQKSALYMLDYGNDHFEHFGGSSAAVEDDKILPNPASLVANKTQKTQPYVTTESSQEITESSNNTFDYDLTTDPVDSKVENKTLSYNAVQNNVT